MKRDAKTREQVEAERIELASLIQRISLLVSRVPKNVLHGSYQLAVDWKMKASSAKKLCEQKAPNLIKARNAFAELMRFE